MQYSHCYCLLPIVVKSKPMISKLHLVSTQKFVWHACIVCVRFQGDKGILSFCLYDCLCLCAQLYQTTIIQRDVCVAQCPLCVEQPQPRQTMPHWSHTHSPAASGEDTKMMSRCLSKSQSPTFCPSSQLRFAKMTSRSPLVPIGARSRLANCACKNNQWWTYLNEKVVKTVANDCFHLRNKFAVTILRFLHLAPFSLILSRSWSLLGSRWKSQSGPLSEWVSGPQRREADKDSKIGWL